MVYWPVFSKRGMGGSFCIYWAEKIRASLARCSSGIRFLCFFEKAASFPGGSENRRKGSLPEKVRRHCHLSAY